MSLSEYKYNIIINKHPIEIKVNNLTYFEYKENSPFIFRKKLNEIINGTGVNESISSDIKNRKVQECFETHNQDSKNIFNDNNIHKLFEPDTTIKSRNLKKTFVTNKKYKHYIHRHNERKNFLTSKTETQYSNEYDKSRIINQKSYFKMKNNNFMEYYNRSSNISPNKKKKSNNITINSNTKNTNRYNIFYSPVYTDKNIMEKDYKKYEHKSITNSILIKDYNRASKMTNKPNNKFSFNLSNSINSINKNKKKGFYPLTSNFKSEYDLSNNNIYNKNFYYNLNKSESKNQYNSNLLYSNLTKSEENSTNNKMELTYETMKKILSLFLFNMTKFYITYFKNIFNLFISKLKKSLKNKDYYLENKIIENKSEIKNKIRSNPYYNVYNKHSQIVLEDVENKENINLQNNNNYIKNFIIKNNIIKNIVKSNNIDKIQKKTDMKKDMIKKKYFLNYKQSFNKNNKGKEGKKYFKKKVSQKIKKSKSNIENIKKDNNKQCDIFNKFEYFDEDIRKRKMHKSLDERGFLKYNDSFNIKIDKREITLYNFSKRKKNKKGIKPIFFKKTNIPNPFIKINKRTSSCNFINNMTNIFELNDNKKNIFEINFLEGISRNKKKLNMNMRYREFDEISINPKTLNNNINENNYLMDNNFTNTIIIQNDSSKIKNKENNDNKTFSKKNFKDSILTISNSINNKKINNKLNSLLIKIILNKINKEKKQNINTIKKYFNLLKYDKLQIKQKIFMKKTKCSLNSKEETEINNKNYNLFNEKTFFNDNEYFDKNKTEKNNINNSENIENNNSISKKGRNFGVTIKKITVHKSLTKSVLSPKMGKIKNLKETKNKNQYLTDFDIHSKGIMNRNFSLSFNNDNKSLYKINNQNKIQKKENNQNIKNDIEKSLKYNKSYRNLKNSNLNIINEINYNIENKYSNKKPHNIKMLTIRNYFEEEGKSFIIPHIKRSNENKINNNISKSIIEGDITLNEKYQDYKNLIYFLRNKLIYCFIIKRKNNDSYID